MRQWTARRRPCVPTGTQLEAPRVPRCEESQFVRRDDGDEGRSLGLEFSRMLVSEGPERFLLLTSRSIDRIIIEVLSLEPPRPGP